MASKSRQRVYATRPTWDRVSDQKRIAADADAFLRDALGEDAADLALLGGIVWTPRQILSADQRSHVLDAVGEETAAEIRAADGATGRAKARRALDRWQVADALGEMYASPEFDYVTQSGTTSHRDRRAFMRPTTRTFYRPPCDEAVTGQPCPRKVAKDGQPTRHQCATEGATFVRQLQPYGDPGIVRSQPTRQATRPVAGRRKVLRVATAHGRPNDPQRLVASDRTAVVGALDARPLRWWTVGHSVSKRRGRPARTTTVGRFVDATYKVDPAEMVERLGATVATLAPGEDPWLVSDGTYVDVPWQRPALIVPEPRKATGRPRKATVRGKRAANEAAARLSTEMRASLDAVLTDILAACDRARAIPDRTVAAVPGLQVTYRDVPDHGPTVMLASEQGIVATSWKARRSAARAVALEQVGA